VNNPTLGAKGAGVHPIMLASYVDFMLAEAVQTANVVGDAKALLLSGIKKHMDYVRAFAKASPDGSAVNTYETDAQYNAKVTSYLTYVGNEFDTSSKKMFTRLASRSTISIVRLKSFSS
jgi:hypothetical protein